MWGRRADGKRSSNAKLCLPAVQSLYAPLEKSLSPQKRNAATALWPGCGPGGMAKRQVTREQLEERLRDAFLSDRFDLFYQSVSGYQGNPDPSPFSCVPELHSGPTKADELCRETERCGSEKKADSDNYMDDSDNTPAHHGFITPLSTFREPGISREPGGIAVASADASAPPLIKTHTLQELNRISPGLSERPRVAHVCLHFARGCCYHGEACASYHRVPDDAIEASTLWSLDCFGREREAFHDERLQGPGIFTRDIRTIWVSNLRKSVGEKGSRVGDGAGDAGGARGPQGRQGPQRPQRPQPHRQSFKPVKKDAMRDAVLAFANNFGQVVAIQPCARGVPGLLVQYRLRTQAEFARQAMHRQRVEGCVLVVRWSVANIVEPSGRAGQIVKLLGGSQGERETW